MRIGQLRTRVAIQQPVDAGGGLRTWGTLITVWGEVETLQGSERAAGLEPTNVRTNMVTIRHPRSSFTVQAKMRLAFDGRLLEIDSVVPDQLKRTLTLSCREVTT